LYCRAAGWSVLRTRRYREHLQRGLSQFGSMLCWFLAVSVLSLGSATALGFAAPLFTTLLSIVILKEKVVIHRWSALIVGFVGVLIITHPGAGTLTYGALFALGNAVLISTVAIAIRRMSITESAETLTLYQMSIMTLCTAGLLTLGFQAPHLGDALMLALALSRATCATPVTCEVARPRRLTFLAAVPRRVWAAAVLRGSVGLAATGALARPHIANAATTTAELWWVQGCCRRGGAVAPALCVPPS
jgi:hypothetical protein